MKGKTAIEQMVEILEKKMRYVREKGGINEQDMCGNLLNEARRLASSEIIKKAEEDLVRPYTDIMLKTLNRLSSDEAKGEKI